MVCKISKVDVWAGTIQDRPGGLADKLDTLSKARASLEFPRPEQRHIRCIDTLVRTHLR